MGTHIKHRFEEEEGSLSGYDGLAVDHFPDTQTFEAVYFGEDELNYWKIMARMT